MSYSPMDAIKDFHIGIKVRPVKWGHRDGNDTGKTLRLRRKLIAEEAQEATEALYQLRMNPTVGNLEEVAKELADVLVVVYGTADVLGIDLQGAFTEVMRSNMSKLRDATFREDGKLLKGPHYTKPDMWNYIWKAV